MSPCAGWCVSLRKEHGKGQGKETLTTRTVRTERWSEGESDCG